MAQLDLSLMWVQARFGAHLSKSESQVLLAGFTVEALFSPMATGLIYFK